MISRLEWYDEICLGSLLSAYSQLRLLPCVGSLVLSGDLSFDEMGPNGKRIADTYTIKIDVQRSFPNYPPSVWEISNRIPKNFHKLQGNMLCLGAPTQLLLALRKSPSLLEFVDRFVVPYLFGYSYFEKFGQMPFGELSHGSDGVREYLREMYSSPAAEKPELFLFLTSLNKRAANKRPCPCGVGLRLGRCHHEIVNRYRGDLGREWFSKEYRRFLNMRQEEEHYLNRDSLHDVPRHLPLPTIVKPRRPRIGMS